MQKIGKNHEIIQFFKDSIKTNKHKDITISDDLEVLSLVEKYNISILYLLYTPEIDYQEETKNLLNSLLSTARESYEISLSLYQQLCLKENHAGILAAMKLPEYSFTDLKDFILVLDHLEIPGNIGTIYRTLDACKADGVIMVDSITRRHNPKITSSARGTNLIIPTVTATYEETLKFLLDNDYTVFLGEPELGQNYQQYTYKGKIAIVVGNERFGINPDWYNHPHKKVFIPMGGNNNSLNVGVAASIIAYEAAMKRNNF